MTNFHVLNVIGRETQPKSNTREVTFHSNSVVPRHLHFGLVIYIEIAVPVVRCEGKQL